LSRIKPFPDGKNPWQLAPLRIIEGGTSGSLATVRFEYQPDPFKPGRESLALGMSAEQARTVADLLNEAADIAERHQMEAPPVQL
jgi:hypothetical protein